MDLINLFTKNDGFERYHERFEDEKNLRKMFVWKHIQSQIDPSIGRNTLLALLKIKGILNRYNRPNPKSPYYQYFKKVLKITSSRSIHYMYEAQNVYYISGQGIVEIRKEIDSVRQKGGSI